MNRLATILQAIAELREAANDPDSRPVHSVCVLAGPHDPQAVADAWPGRILPAELDELWRITGGARLFEDIDYGQWGLVLLSADASRHRTEVELQERPADMSRSDIVIGEFLGDQELLVYSSGEGVLVALPLDDRSDWFRAAPTLAEFLERLMDSQGEKFWERSPA